MPPRRKRCRFRCTVAGKDKDKIYEQDISIEQLLRARGFLKEINGAPRLTNAAVLLFAKNINQFYPNCRIRFIRYDGNAAMVGTQFNVIKDFNMEYSIMRIIDKARKFIATQLREFTTLGAEVGTFHTVPEYPEFAWLEGIVNAVTHREYGLAGDYIKVVMFDDRLEIQSPGKFPGLVTVENILKTRFSRNPRIARVLTEMGWVRELNEGVKRIYSEMESFFLEEPTYTVEEQSVKLVLKNNIVMRHIRQQDNCIHQVGFEVWEQLDDLERDMLVYLSNHSQSTRADFEKQTGKAGQTIRNRIKHLIQMNIIVRRGNRTDPNQYYSFSETIFKK